MILLNKNDVTLWTSFTPIIGATAAGANFTDLLVLGNGTKTGYYRKSGPDSIDVRISLVWGSTTTLAAGFYWYQLPGAAVIDSTKINTDPQNFTLGLYMYHDLGVGVFTGSMGFWPNDLTKLHGSLYNTAGTYSVSTSTSGTVPAAPASGDEHFMSIFGLPVTGI